MCTAFYGIDIVDVRMYVFCKRIVVAHGYFYWNVILLGRNINGFFDYPLTGAIQVVDKFRQSGFRIKYLLFERAVSFPDPFICQRKFDFLVQESEFTQTGRENVKFELCCSKYRVIGCESDNRSRMISCTYDLYIGLWRSFFIFLFPDFAIAMNFCPEIIGKGIHAGNTYAMQTSGDFITLLVELPSGMQYGKNHLQSRFVFTNVQLCWNPATIIHDSH